MPEQRVSDETIANLIAGKWEQHEGRVIVKLALDLRDARALLAAVRPVVAAATKWSDAHDGRQPDGDTESAYEALWSAVDDLPAEAREWAAP